VRVWKRGGGAPRRGAWLAARGASGRGGEGTTAPDRRPDRNPPPQPAPKPCFSSRQALLAVYFFLAGLLFRGHPYLWVMPVAFTAFALAHGAAGPLAALLSPRRGSGIGGGGGGGAPAPRAEAWRGLAAHLAYSAAAGAGGAALVALEPRALSLEVRAGLFGSNHEGASRERPGGRWHAEQGLGRS
jgi:hypothetical protein